MTVYWYECPRCSNRITASAVEHWRTGTKAKVLVMGWPRCECGSDLVPVDVDLEDGGGDLQQPAARQE